MHSRYVCHLFFLYARQPDTPRRLTHIQKDIRSLQEARRLFFKWGQLGVSCSLSTILNLTYISSGLGIGVALAPTPHIYLLKPT